MEGVEVKMTVFSEWKDVMKERYSLQFEDTDLWERPAREAFVSGKVTTQRVSLLENIQVQDPVSNLPAQADGPKCIALNLEKLKSFEVVDRQFADLGVTFTNAIALQPSNPAFPPRSGTMVLIGGPRSGWLEGNFLYPVCCVSCFVTSSRQMVLSAYDADDQLLAQVEIPESNLAGSDSAIAPNSKLTLQVPNISRITFYAFDGQFSIDDFQFSI